MDDTLDYGKPDSQSRLFSGKFIVVPVMVMVVGIVLFVTVVLQIVYPGRPDYRNKTTLAAMRNLKMALEAFNLDNGRYPTTAEGIAALCQAPLGLPHWQKCIDEESADGWGSPFHYSSPGPAGLPFDLHSSGPDKIDGTADDVPLK